MYSKTIAACLVFISLSCHHGNSWLNADHPSAFDKVNKGDTVNNENPYPEVSAIPVPEGFKRPVTGKNSFSNWLGHIHLKKNKTVYLFDGTEKGNQAAQFAVLDIPVGTQNLQQCADAVMRLRASYLFEQEKFDSIVFYDNDRNSYRFSAPYTQQHFNDYLQIVFGMCGSASLSKQLKKIDYKDIQPGDVLIRGGFPGHAEIVLDVVINSAGAKKYLLAQSYMPAQDIHVLVNPANEDQSPWYEVTDDSNIRTPEYTFHSDEWRRW